MTEDYYTLLMRKGILGISTEEEDNELFDWLDEDDEYFNFYAWLCLKLTSMDEPDLDAILSRDNTNEVHKMSKAKLDTLLQRYWQNLRSRDAG